MIQRRMLIGCSAGYDGRSPWMLEAPATEIEVKH